MFKRSHLIKIPTSVRKQQFKSEIRFARLYRIPILNIYFYVNILYVHVQDDILKYIATISTISISISLRIPIFILRNLRSTNGHYIASPKVTVTSEVAEFEAHAASLQAQLQERWLLPPPADSRERILDVTFFVGVFFGMFFSRGFLEWNVLMMYVYMI